MAYKDIINNICSNIHTGLIDFDEPRSEASMPTQASSEFITNKQQGDWAEDVLFRAINDNSENIVAVRYGKSDDFVAGDAGFEKFFNEYQAELDTMHLLVMTSARSQVMRLVIMLPKQLQV